VSIVQTNMAGAAVISTINHVRFGLVDELAVLAHEVRGALLAARAVVERLQLGGAPIDGDEALERARIELEDIALASDRLLEWATGSVPRFVPVDLEQLAAEVAHRCMLAAGDHRVRVFGPGGLTAVVDEASLEVGLGNLIRNALAYSEPHTWIDVSAARARGEVVLSVTNSGPGVPMELRDAIFRPLVRRPGGRGRGLGLFIAAQVAQMHGGRISLDDAFGTTTLRINIPIVRRRGMPSAS